MKPCQVNQLPQDLQNSGRRPVLHLLRRDLEHLYKEEHELYDAELARHKAPFLATIGILSALDLMAKFYGYAPRPHARTVRRRSINGLQFRTFLTHIGGLSRRDATLMWNLRNSLIHSYTLRLAKPHSRAGVSITTGPDHASWYVRQRAGRRPCFIVNMWGLKKLLLATVAGYQSALSDQRRRTLRQRFLRGCPERS